MTDIKAKTMYTVNSWKNAGYSSVPKLPSASAEKQNLLLNKVTPFKKYIIFPSSYLLHNYELCSAFVNTSAKTERKSIIYRIADNIYAKKSPRKASALSVNAVAETPLKNKSVVERHSEPTAQQPLNKQTIEMPEADETLSKKLSVQNLSKAMLNSRLLQNLNSKTAKVPQYNDLILALMKEKQFLTEKIEMLKRKILQESKEKAKLSLQSKKHMNSTEHTNDNINKIRVETERVDLALSITTDDCNYLKKELNELDKKNKQTLRRIEEERRQIQELEEFNKTAKQSLLKEDKRLNETKANLTVALKSMNNNSQYIKYLESEKAEVLLYINKETEQNKISTK